MSLTYDGNRITMKASTDMARGRVVKLAATQEYVTYCTATDDDPFGVTLHAADTAGDAVAIQTFSPGQIYLIKAATTVAYSVATDDRGNPLGLTTAGQVTPNTSQQRFVALEAVSEAGLVKCMAVASIHNAV